LSRVWRAVSRKTTGFPCWPFFQVDPTLENLRGEPRFQRLIEDLERKYTALKISRT
jgi:hypothetical protein